MVDSSLVITIDGTAGCGKSTIAKKLSRRLDALYLNSGLLYRGLASMAISRGIAVDDVDSLVALLEECTFSFAFKPGGPTVFSMGREVVTLATLMSDQIADTASEIAVHPLIRAPLTLLQQEYITRVPRAVIEGRDAGTVVAPDAQLKVFLDAPLRIRAGRRLRQLHSVGHSEATLPEVLAGINARDTRDRERTYAPLKSAAGAVVYDTEAEQVRHIVRDILLKLEVA